MLFKNVLASFPKTGGRVPVTWPASWRGTWASLDGNFWWGGVTTLDGIRNPASRQTSSRVGGTVAFRVSTHQSIKVSYSGGTYVRFGGDYQNISVAWQYSWLGRPR